MSFDTGVNHEKVDRVLTLWWRVYGPNKVKIRWLRRDLLGRAKEEGQDGPARQLGLAICEVTHCNPINNKSLGWWLLHASQTALGRHLVHLSDGVWALERLEQTPPALDSFVPPAADPF